MEPLSAKYDLVNSISASHDSDVYLVRGKDTDERFLLKSLKENPDAGKDAVSRKIRFAREMDIISALDHPRIARPVDTLVDDKTYSIIYPYRKGQTLAKTLEQGRIISESEAVNIVLQILDALEYIHARGIIHVDINPYNMFLDVETGIELLDFGVSMTEEEARKFPQGRIVGTLPYMAPEQMGFTDFQIDTRTDLYCVALVLYRLLSGAMPFGDYVSMDSLSDLLNATLKREVPPVKKINATLNSVILKALKPSPDDRYQTAEGFKSDLRHAFRELEGNVDGLFILGEKDAITSVNRSKLFVARETEMSQLEKGLDKLKRREFSSFLIYARSGTGKTEIVRRFNAITANATIAGGQNCFFLPSKCNQFTPHQPYSMFRHIICEFVAQINRDTESSRKQFRESISKQLVDYSGIICQTIPEMRDFFDEVRVVDKVEPEKEADRISHVLSILLVTLCECKPLIIFIDDLQWIDLVSFEICRKVMREKPPCMLVYNYRTDANETDLYVFGNDLHHIGIERLIHIQPFTRDETKELISSRFGEVKNNAELVEMLFGKTDGNPFVLTEAVRFLVNSEFLVREERGWVYKMTRADTLPDKFDSVSLILGKQEKLNNEERRCLGLVSLIQGKFDVPLVRKFTDSNEMQAKICLHRFENQGFIVAHFKGGYSFSHDKIQESIAEEIPPEEKGGLYERLAGIYEQMAAEDRENVYNAAECYLKTKNLLKAIDISYKAALYATEQIAFDVAIRYFKNAQFLLQQCAKINIAQHVDPIKVEIALGDVLMLTGKNEQALKIFEGLLIIKAQLDPYQLLEVKYKIGSIYHNMGEFEKSIPHLRDALRKLGISYSNKRILVIFSFFFELIKEMLFSLGLTRILSARCQVSDFLTSKILSKLAYSLYFSDMVSSLYMQFKSCNFAARLVDSIEKAEAFVMQGVAIYQLFQKRKAVQYQKKALAISSKIDRKDSLAFTRSIMSLVNYYYANWKNCEESAQTSIATFNSIGNISGQILSAEHLWKSNFLQGQFARASKNMNMTIGLCEKSREIYYKLVTQSAKLLTDSILNGTYEENDYIEIDNLLQKMPSFLFHIETGSNLVQYEILHKKNDVAYSRLIKLMPLIWRKCLNSEYQVRAFALFCELIILSISDQRKNRSSLNLPSNLENKFLFNLVVLWFSCLSYPAYWGSYFRSKAWWHALKNRKQKAHRYFLKAIKAHHSLDMRYEEARSIRDYGDFLQDFCNLPGEARDKYTEAYKLFEWCGAKLETERIKSKVDLSCIESKDTIVTQGDETTTDFVTTSFTTAAGINQLRVNTLYDLSNSIQQIEDINELLHLILKSMINATGAQFGRLFVGGNEHHEKQSLLMDFEGAILSERTVAYSRAIVDRVEKTQEVILIRDGMSDRDMAGEMDKDMRSILCLPLTRGESFHGCVYLGNNMVTNLFSEDSKKTALIIAAEAGILLENAYLMSSYKRLNRDLQKKVREQTADIREKNEKLAEYNLKIVDSERMKSLLSGTLVHDIKNYAAGIEGNAALLGRHFPTEPRVLKTVRIVSNCCLGIVSLASNLLDIGKMEEGKLVIKKEPLTGKKLFDMADQLRQNIMFEEKAIAVTLIDNTNDQFAIEADLYLVERVMQNIFSNAAKYVPRSGKVLLRLETNENECIVSFYNSGNPIPDEDKLSLFEKYTRVDSKGSQYSKGLGLFFCKMVMNAHKGRIWLDTDETGNYFKLAFQRKTAQSHMLPAA